MTDDDLALTLKEKDGEGTEDALEIVEKLTQGLEDVLDVATLIPALGWFAWSVRIGLRLRRRLKPNLDAARLSAMESHVARLLRTVVELRERVAVCIEQIGRQKVSEHVAQGVLDLSGTASEEKRRTIANVLLNGLTQVSPDAFRLEHFRRASIDMSPEHFDVLRRVAEYTTVRQAWEDGGMVGDQPELFLPSDAERAILTEMVPRGFVEAPQFPPPDLHNMRVRILPLGLDLLEWSLDPPELKSV